jgi:hypothetical protein
VTVSEPVFAAPLNNGKSLTPEMILNSTAKVTSLKKSHKGGLLQICNLERLKEILNKKKACSPSLLYFKANTVFSFQDQLSVRLLSVAKGCTFFILNIQYAKKPRNPE